MDETTRATLDKLIDPLVPAGTSDFREVLELLDVELDERFIIDVLKEENIVPVTDHPLHQKKVLALAEEFRGSGFADASRFLAEEVLKAPNLGGAVRDHAVLLAGRPATR